MKISFSRAVYINITLAALFIQLGINTGCASKGTPSGGPIDKTPPEIIYSFPEQDSVNVKDLKSVIIHFSESIDESSVANNIFISPPLKFEAEWDSDTELFIHLIDTLHLNQTYVVVIGAKVKDIRGNNLPSTYQLAFSTGSKIDRGNISGKVYDQDKNQSYSIFVYRLKSEFIDLASVLPDYISQTGGDNKYTVDYLRYGLYRVFAVADQNNNMLVDVNSEKLGIPYIDIQIDSSFQSFKNLNFRLTKIDTTAPSLNFVRSINSNQLNLNFSEKVIIDSMVQISIFDSVSSNPVTIFTTSENIEADNVLEVYTSRMDSGNVYLCKVTNFSDLSGNISETSTHSFSARGFSVPDSFSIVSFTPADSVLTIHPNSVIYLEFSNPINKQLFVENFKLTSTDIPNVNGYMIYPSAYEIEFHPDNSLILDHFYNIHLNLRNIRNVWGDSLGDSLLLRSFKINSGDDYGDISGMIVPSNNQKIDTYIQAENYKDKTKYFSTWVITGNTYKINNVPDGIYSMSAYFDSDSNSVFSAGNLFPFTYSEPFIVREDTVKVRKRWESGDVNLFLPKVNY